MGSPIQDGISSLKFSLSPSDYKRTKQSLSIIESRIESEKAELEQKFANSLKDNQILTKQLEQYKGEHSDLLIANLEFHDQLDESRFECTHLRVRLAAADQEVQRVNFLEKQIAKLSDENASLEAAKLKIEEELRDCRLQREKDIAEISKIRGEKTKLQCDLDGVLQAATRKFKLLMDQLSVLEQTVEKMNKNGSDSGS
ncbi:hypothetical protein SOVF_189690 [Spinacia oleracea]|nr:hypothetical protein SOVF_189690 [Spinacia oleracea]